MRINETSTWKLKVDGTDYTNKLNDMERSLVELKEKQELNREDLKTLILFIMDNNKTVHLPLQGRVTVSRLRKEI